MNAKFVQYLTELKPYQLFIIDTIFFTITPILALTLRLDNPFDYWTTANYFWHLAIIILLFLVIKLTVFYTFGLYKRYWRVAGIDELMQIASLVGLSILIEVFLLQIIYSLTDLPIKHLPRSLPFLDGMLSFILIGGIRFSIPLLERLSQRTGNLTRCQRVAVFGSGSAGIALVQQMQRNPKLCLDPIAFFDDDPKKLNLQIRGVTVVGDRHKIAQAARSLNIQKIIIAIPTASGKDLREIAEICQSLGLATSTLPGISEILNGDVRMRSVRDVQIEDLLRREPIQTDTQKVSQFINKKRILITGAGGSIGSELCRQVLKLSPAEIVLIGHGENSVFNIQQELERIRSELRKQGELESNISLLTAFIVDIRFRDRLEYVFEKFRPEIIFHTAAHKHVPMMELNPPEAITNNVQGTKNLIELAVKYNVENFVMISTDKAVNPTSIMGASKRVAEMLVLQAAQQHHKNFVIVRFGNVLGSRGSVVPTFKQQIAEGGPITITHPEIIRYFMTIPESVQLLLQAAVIGHSGQVFMLDMGKPVKILDLAKDLIRLCGYELGKDIEIIFTGLRPGEKLFEELFIRGEKYERTEHGKILLVVNASRLVRKNINSEVAALFQAALQNDSPQILFLLEQLVPEYIPEYSTANQVREKLWLVKHQSLPQLKSKNTEFMELETELQQALDRQEFRIHYQPIIVLETDRITGFEVLLRWQHPIRGLLWPDELLPAAEETGLIISIGEWVLRQACSQMQIWQSQFPLNPPLTVSVNLTSKQFFDANLIEMIGKILKETNLDASSLRLEIPEDVVIQNSELTGCVLVKLKTLGVQVQIDHCGLSNVSLTHLYQLTRLKYGKFASLKLDFSLVSGLDTNNPNLEILYKIMAIAQELGMDMIATGVETSWQIDQLKAMKCLYGQGYFFSKPVDQEKAGILIQADYSKPKTISEKQIVFALCNE
jgi:FlaA1/EpsC-like NDP-sugar epimerase/EAL domain-containing protein (putative c-di-GMP-specific phosphodiesterase class I)